ncbi:MAG: hypothetical protein ACD_54C01176G0002 [uncultured bacterium]|nr:MAG: hypothetical protein ACD_54C01176G0002 [uncultured bacterium]
MIIRHQHVTQPLGHQSRRRDIPRLTAPPHHIRRAHDHRRHHRMRRHRRPPGQRKLGDLGPDHRIELAGLAIGIVMAAIKHAQLIESLRQPAQAARHLFAASHRQFDAFDQLLGGLAHLARPGGKIGRRDAGHMLALQQVIIEHHIADPMPLHRRDQPLSLAHQMRLRPDLQPQIGQRLRAVLIQRRHQRFGMVGAAVAAFPAPALRQIGGGHAMAGRLAVERGEPHRQRQRCRWPRGHMAFKPVAMQVDDAWQHQKPRQIHLGQRTTGDAALGKADRAVLQGTVTQNLGSGQAERWQGQRHGKLGV